MARKKDEPFIKAGNGPLVALVVAGLVGAGVWFGFTAPARAGAHHARTQLSQASQTLQSNEAQLTDLKSGKQGSANQLLTRARELDALLPQSVDRTQVVAHDDELATGLGLNLTSMTPGTVTTTGLVSAQPYAAAVQGPPAAVASFIAALADQDPLSTISSFTLTTSAGKSSATFTITTWSLAAPLLAAQR